MWLSLASPLFCPFILLILLSAGFCAVSGYVRVESGRQRIRVDERDPYEGHYTRLTFDRPRCIQSLNVDCLVPLTGAEDIEIIYTECSGESNWRLAHYSNSGGNFVLARPLFARKIAIVSSQTLSVVDVSVQPCNDSSDIGHLQRKHENCEKEHVESKPVPNAHRHVPRKHHSVHRKEKFTVLEDVVRRRRVKRDASQPLYSKRDSPYTIKEDIVVPDGELLRITEGARLAFVNNTGIIAYGTLQIEGSKHEPVLLYPLHESWKGLVIHGSGGTRSRSELRYVNVSGSVHGIRLEGPPFANLEHVTSDGNQNGITIEAAANKTAKVVKKITALRSEP